MSIAFKFEKFLETEIRNKLLSVIEVLDKFKCYICTRNFEFTKYDSDLSVISKQLDTFKVRTFINL